MWIVSMMAAFTRSVIFIALVRASRCLEGPIVKTPLGSVQGVNKISHGGRKFSAFEGIPYAKPPIDNLRFEPPEPVEQWSGVWDTKFPTICAQRSVLSGDTIMGDEDCLHINVYVPRETPNPTDNLDVIVHVHGGAYMMGHGNLYCASDFVMDRDVIFITFNYRLGILGFLSTEDNVVSGNSGLKDQAIALRWVRDNIASFGGNPDSVTLNGISAGGSSVHFHYFSEWSKGLFHRGFSQSGVALNSWSIQEEPLSKAKQLAAAVGCPTECTKKLVNCLKQRPYHQLLDKLTVFHDYKFFPIAPFAPVVEKGSKPFLKDYPFNLLKRKEVLDVPWIASHVSYEGLFPGAILRQELDTIDKQWNTIAPTLLDFNYTVPKSSWETASEKIRAHYFEKDEAINEKTFYKFVQLFSDRFFLVDAETAILLQAEANKSPVYYQWFAYPGDNHKAEEVGHGYDAKYYYGNVMTGEGPLTENELKMKDIVWDLLVSYTKTNTPQLDGVKWEPTGSSSLTYLDINGINPGDIRLQTTKSLAPRKFWNSLRFLENENLVKLKEEL